MKKFWFWIILGVVFFAVFLYLNNSYKVGANFSDTEIEFGEDVITDLNEVSILDEDISELELQMLLATTSRGARWAYWWKEFSPSEKNKYLNFKRPVGPPRVGIQVGHWKNTEVPEELDGLKRSGGGAVGGGKQEVDIVLQIAQKVKASLETEGIVVDLLPATVPVDYVADAFISIHADGNNNTSVSGYKVASPQRDFSLKSTTLAKSINDNYKKETGLSEDGNITRRMSGYYAFNWRRYEHAVHPMTPSVILETGFLTSPEDRKIIVNNQAKAVVGITKGILEFLDIIQL